jgi:hypothetical protein
MKNLLSDFAKEQTKKILENRKLPKFKAGDTVKKLATLGGMPGVKTRQIQIGQGVAEGSDHSLKKVWDRYSKHLMAARGDHPNMKQINKSGEIVRNIRKYVKDHHGQQAVDDMERYAEKSQWNEGVAEGNRGQLRVAAPKSEILSATDTGKIITIRVRAPDGTPKTFSNPNPSIVQKWLDKYDLRLPHQIASKFVYEQQQSTKSMITESRTYKLWESAGHKLMEAQLTADQITQIFQQVEQGATAAGGNRTLIGKGKDAATAVNAAWEDLKTKVQNSGPIKGVDAMYDQAAEQLKQATGGDQGVMKYVQKYRDFAKAHPVAQSLIYAALIAAAGITGVAPGGAAVLGLFKLVDKLLQGEKFSSAAYSGAKTGAIAYSAAKVADYFKGSDQATSAGGGEVPADIQQGLASDQAFQDRILNKFPPDKGYTFSSSDDSLQVFDSAGRKVFTGDIPLKTMNMKQFADLTNNGQMATPGITSGSISGDPMAGISNAGSDSYRAAQAVASTTGNPPDGMNPSFYTRWFINKYAQDPSNPSAMIIQQAKQYAATRAKVNESIELTESQIFLMIGKIVERQRKLDEGIMDTLKGAAGKAVDWAKTKGTNLTTKITADKLLQAWKKAGSPTDSLDVAKVIQSAGVPAASIKQVYGTMQIPFAGEPDGGATPAVNPTAQAPSAAPLQPDADLALLQKATASLQDGPALTAQELEKVNAYRASRGAPAIPSTAPKSEPVAQQPVAPAQPAQAGATGSAQGFNASNVMKMPGMEKYAKPAATPAAKTANFGGGPTGYSKTTTTIKPSSTASAKQPTVAAESSEESLADQFMKMAQAKGYNVHQAGTPEQERERSQQRLAQREKDQAEKQQQDAQADFEQLPELKAEYQKMHDLYKSLGGSNWQYADREQNLTGRERQARDMENQLSILSRRIKRAEQLKEQSGLGFGEAKHEEKIAGRYDPDDFDLMVKRLGQRAREQQKSRPVDVQDLARKLRAIEQSKDEK